MSVEETAKGISAIVNNTLTALWVCGLESHARAPLRISPDTSQYGKQVQQGGFTLFSLTSPDGVLAGQFPPTMYFVVPTGQFKTIVKLIAKAKKEALLALEHFKQVTALSQETGWSPDGRSIGIEVPGVPNVHDPLAWKH